MTSRRFTSHRRSFLTSSVGIATVAAVGPPVRALGQQATPAATPVAVEPPDMTGATYEFQLGSFTCWSVSDGANAGPFVKLIVFGATPDEEEEAIIRETGIDLSQLVSQHTSTVIDTGSELVLVDTGAGAPGLPETGILADNLRRMGIQPGEIDMVVLTHGHPDHIGGTVTATGNPLYSNARYVMAQEEWEFWTDPVRVEEEAVPADFLETFLATVDRALLPLEGAIELVGYGEELLPGITTVDARGHTPGHMGLMVESEGEQLWVMGDAALNPIDLPYPEVIGAPDINPEQVIETRRRLFAEIAGSGNMAVFNHFHPFPSLGLIESEGDAWAWLPIEVEDDAEG
ncbi:MAG TPA: MBL fold metallo-hydrolase [Thermomicrobiales bacterium]|nr:MBL fold metallo-hydrolase [Thermomicrobiales bacterium]